MKPNNPKECITCHVKFNGSWTGECPECEQKALQRFVNSNPTTTGSQNPGREEIYDEMTAHIKGDNPTGEWTAKKILLEFQGEGWATRLAEAINAAIAAKNQEIASDNLQLAAERKSVKIMEGQIKDLEHDRDTLRRAKAEQRKEWHDTLKQLAAEQEISKEWFDKWGDTKAQLAAAYKKSEEPRCDFVSHLKLEQQLGAVVEALKVSKRHLEATTQALGEFTTSDGVAVLILIDAALAKIKL